MHTCCSKPPVGDTEGPELAEMLLILGITNYIVEVGNEDTKQPRTEKRKTLKVLHITIMAHLSFPSPQAFIHLDTYICSRSDGMS